MKNRNLIIGTFFFLLFLATVLANNTAQRNPVNNIIIGDGDSTIAKSYSFNSGLGPLDPKFFTNDGSQIGLFSNEYIFGTGANQNVNIVADIGLGVLNPFLRFDATESSWIVSNDGENPIILGSGTGGSEGGVNLLLNPGAEQDLQGWDSSGGTFTQEEYVNGTSNNEHFFNFVTTASGQYVDQLVPVIPDFINGGCMADFRFIGGDNAFKYSVLSGIDTLTSDITGDSTAWVKAPTLTFACPVSGQVSLRIESLGAGELSFDQAYLGSNRGVITTARDGFLRLSASVGGPSGGLSGPGVLTNQYGLGNGEDWISSANWSNGILTLNLAKSFSSQPNCGGSIVRFGQNNPGIHIYFDRANTTDTVLRFSTGGSTGGSFAQVVNIFCTLVDEDNSSRPAISVETSNFFISGQIFAGGNAVASTSNIHEIGSSSAQLLMSKGSAEIACFGSSSTAGTTCNSLGTTEVIGFSFNAPSAGRYEICDSMFLFGSGGGSVTISSRMFIMGDSNNRVDEVLNTHVALSGTSTGGQTSGTCGTLDVSSAGPVLVKRWWRGTGSNLLVIDNAVSEFNRSYQFSIKKIGQSTPSPILLNQVTTGASGGAKKGVCHIVNNGTAIFDSNDPDCWFMESVSGVTANIVSVEFTVAGLKCVAGGLSRVNAGISADSGGVTPFKLPKTILVTTNDAVGGTALGRSFALACSINL